ncbi:MAG: hypothetical protein JF600_05515 [Xanthomonadales bacterium]|nr:hypothetical protein [Xanthomonadales bacterium]
MTPRALRAAGWACIALAKVGSLYCLWQVLRAADAGPAPADAAWALPAWPVAAALALAAAILGLGLLARGGRA